MSKRTTAYVTTIAVAALLVASADPAFSQGVGGGVTSFGDPITMIQNIARAALLGGGGLTVISGVGKAIRVYYGHADPFDMAWRLVAGVGMIFGTAATMGFS